MGSRLRSHKFGNCRLDSCSCDGKAKGHDRSNELVNAHAFLADSLGQKNPVKKPMIRLKIPVAVSRMVPAIRGYFLNMATPLVRVINQIYSAAFVDRTKM